MSRPSPPSHAVAAWTATLVTVLWSSSWILIRAGLDHESLPPVTFAGLRYGLAAAVLMLWVASKKTRRSEIRRLDRSSLVQCGVLGVVFYTLTQGAQFIAIDNQPAATTSLVLSLTPIGVALAGSRSLGELTTRRQWIGAAAVVVGACFYFGGKLGATGIGLAAALVALAANVGGALLGRHVNRSQSMSPVVVTAVSMTIGATLLLAAGLIVDGLPHVSLRAAMIIGWLAVVNTALAFTLWNLSLQRLSAIESAGINNTLLIQIALLAWIFLDEALGTLGVVGIVTVSIGVYLTQTANGTTTSSES